MRKIKTPNIKIGLLIFSFSFIITIAFVGMFVLLSGGFSQSGTVNIWAMPVNTGKNIFTFTMGSEDAELFLSQGYYTLTPENVGSIETYNQNYLQYVIIQILPYAVGFCFLIFALSLGLWFVLKRVQAKNNLLVVEQLNNIQNIDAFASDNLDLIHAYESIKQKFDDNLKDYQRLNSYLSHEQKNAIAILRTRLELAEQTEYLASLDLISESIDDVLTLSETKETVTSAPVDVALVCASVCDNYRVLQNNITFTFDESENTEILAKERWIYRAVANLVSNAVKYGKGNPIEISVRCNYNSVIISVKDKGIGIAKEDREKIFNHRYRINELKKDGYGIGLSLVSHVCDLCGGFAFVESEVDVGSTFYLSFPQKC